jgi:hypothetical protein
MPTCHWYDNALVFHGCGRVDCFTYCAAGFPQGTYVSQQSMQLQLLNMAFFCSCRHAFIPQQVVTVNAQHAASSEYKALLSSYQRLHPLTAPDLDYYH